MNYPVVLAPDLGVSPQDFVEAWNGAPTCRALAQMEWMPQASQEDFPLDAQTVQQGLLLLSGTVAGLALDALKDVVKAKLTEYLEQKLSRKPSVKVEAVRQPGGAYLLVVTQGE